MYIEEVIEKLENVTGKRVKRSGGSYKSNCPAHDDQKPSLSVTSSQDGKILIHCFAGCALESICDAIAISTQDLFSKDNNVGRDSNKKIEYIYMKILQENRCLKKLEGKIKISI